MDELPAEMLYLICRALPQITDIKSFRLTSRKFADIGAAFLLPDVHIFLHPDALTDVERISQHSKVSRNVTSLIFEADILHPYFTYDQWEAQIDGRDPRQFFSHFDEPDTEEGRVQRERELAEWDATPRHQLSDEKLQAGWDAYRRTACWTNALLDSGDDIFALTRILARLPALKRIYLSCEEGLAPRSQRMHNAFIDCHLREIYSINNPKFRTGVRQLEATLCAAKAAATKLHKLHVGSVHWSIFQTDSLAVKYSSLCANVTSFRLRILAGRDLDSNEPQWEAEDCRLHLQKGTLRRFLQSMTNLTTLEVSFVGSDGPAGAPADISHIAGRTVWPQLRKLELFGISAEQHALVDVIERHTSTLKTLYFGDMHLTTGSWIAAFQEVQMKTNLEKALLAGCLSAAPEGASDPLREEDEAKSYDIQLPEEGADPLREAMTEYLLRGGDCPLLNYDYYLKEALPTQNNDYIPLSG